MSGRVKRVAVPSTESAKIAKASIYRHCRAERVCLSQNVYYASEQRENVDERKMGFHPRYQK